MILETINFIKNNNEWKELLSKPPYSLDIKEDDNYYLLKYKMIESDFSNNIVKECRGLVIDKDTLNPVALSFKKFFNVQESKAAKIDWFSAKVQEKVDGSKILLFWDKYNNNWRVCTSGTLNAYETNILDYNLSFGDLFDKSIINIGMEDFSAFSILLDKDYCYTFELVSPESRIVVPYKETKIYFIGARNITNFDEYDPDLFTNLCDKIDRPKEYKLNNLDKCLEATSKMGYDEEGFVVVDKNWDRIKIKSPSYVVGHNMRMNNGVSLKRIVDMVDLNIQDDFLAIYPEYKSYFDSIINKRSNFLNYAIGAYNNLRNKNIFYRSKEYN